MNYKTIDMDSFPRRAHFEYFKGLAYPYVGFTVNVDITGFLAQQKRLGLPFYLALAYCVTRAANSVPEFRRRIHGDGIIEYDWCHGSHTVALPDETYCYCTLDCRMPFDEYLSRAEETWERAKAASSIEDGEDADSLLFFSSIPWMSFTSVIQPTPSPADSNPRINWGKYFRQDGKVLLPLAVLCNHALVDGLHIARFYSALDRELAELTAQLCAAADN